MAIDGAFVFFFAVVPAAIVFYQLRKDHTMHLCAITGCPEMIDDRFLMCPNHWREVSPTTANQQTRVSAADRAAMQAVSNAAWWTRPVCWSGVANDVERAAQAAERRGDMGTARDFARMARAATAAAAASV